jgi:hypothetical protein
MVVLLPIPSVWNLNVPRRQQIMVIMLFGAGFTVCFAGVVRSIYTYKLTQHYDVTWDAYPVWFSTSVELYVGIVSCYLSTLVLGNAPFWPASDTKTTDLCCTSRLKAFLLSLLPKILHLVDFFLRCQIGLEASKLLHQREVIHYKTQLRHRRWLCITCHLLQPRE